MTDAASILAEHRPRRWRSFTNGNTILRCARCRTDFGNATRKAKRGDEERAWEEWGTHVAALIQELIDQACEMANIEGYEKGLMDPGSKWMQVRTDEISRAKAEALEEAARAYPSMLRDMVSRGQVARWLRDRAQQLRGGE